MLQLAPELRAALSKDRTRAVWLVRVEASDTEIFTFTTRTSVGTGYHGAGDDVLTYGGHYPSIVKITPVGAEVDPVTRAYSSGSIEVITADDGASRLMVERHRLKGRPVYLYLGAVGVREQDWLRCGAFVFDDYACEPNQITLYASDPTEIVLEANVRKDNWHGKHPLEVAENILQNSPMPVPLYDAGTLAPVQYEDSISHWTVKDDTVNPARGVNNDGERNADTLSKPGQFSRSTFGAVNVAIAAAQAAAPTNWGEPMPAKGLLTELCQALGGTLLPDETGPVGFRLYDANAELARELTREDFAEPPRMSRALANVCNRVTVSFGLDGGMELVLQDNASAAAFAFPGETERFYDAKFKCAWANGCALLSATISDIATSLRCDEAGQQAFTGTRWDPWATGATPPPQQAEAALSSTRVAYFLIQYGDAGPIEIVKVTGFTPNFTLNGSWNAAQHVRGGTFTIERAQFGTAAVTHQGGAFVYDVTIPVAMATRHLQRFAYGCPEADVRLPLHHVDLQVTDFVGITHAVPCWYQNATITYASAWEIVRKEAETGASPGVKLKLLLARDLAMTPAQTLEYTVPNPKKSIIDSISRLAQGRVYGNPHIISGFEPSGAGLEIILSAGVAATSASRFETCDEARFFAKPSRDTYVFVEPGKDAFALIDVANGDPAPDTPEGAVLLATVETDATSVVTVVDERSFKALDGAALDASTLDDESIPHEALAGASAKGAGLAFDIRKVFTAGAAGTPDDVTIDASLDFDVRIVGVVGAVTTAIGGSTLTARTATGGGGSALSSDLDSGSTGRKESDLASFPTVAAGSPIYLRRSDRGVAGEVIVQVQKI